MKRKSIYPDKNILFYFLLKYERTVAVNKLEFVYEFFLSSLLQKYKHFGRCGDGMFIPTPIVQLKTVNRKKRLQNERNMNDVIWFEAVHVWVCAYERLDKKRLISTNDYGWPVEIEKNINFQIRKYGRQTNRHIHSILYITYQYWRKKWEWSVCAPSMTC